uniref:DNA replication complex GINS protein SLD5 n=1 Tax=Fagus sylvatica TaxID=28930 RepID=A0A2N9IKN1_FAGSY
MASETGEGSTAGIDDYETLISTTDVELLKKAWRNEKAAPEILRFETSLIQRSRGQIQLMYAIGCSLVGKRFGMSCRLKYHGFGRWGRVSKEETIEEYASSGIDPLTVSLYQMDLDRVQYLLRSYLRIRLQKIEKYMSHISKSSEVQSRLSEQEKVFARRCADDMERHLEDSVLSKLPDNYRDIVKQSIISEENDMRLL